MPKFDAANTTAIIIAEGNQPALELTLWLDKIGVTRLKTITHKARDFSTIWNYAIWEALNRTPTDYYILGEGDIRTQNSAQMQPFLDIDADVCCCEYDYNGKVPHTMQWGRSTEFHLGLWRTSRRVLEGIEPWVSPSYSKDGTRETRCLCASLRERLLDAGFTIAHSGHAEHKPRNGGR